MPVGVAAAVLGRAIGSAPYRVRSEATLLANKSRVVRWLVTVCGYGLRLILGNNGIQGGVVLSAFCVADAGG